MDALKRLMGARLLKRDDSDDAGGGELGQDIARLGFRPAFLDTATFSIHLSRFADGRPAPFHLLDGLPDEVVVTRSFFGHVVATKATLVLGFARNGYFYTPSAAARAAGEWAVRT
jgi:hypothetical protein